MPSTTKNRRGMTLAEVAVAIALVSVMAVVAVSFVLFITKRVRINFTNDAVLSDCEKIESGVEAWMDVFASKDAVFKVSETDEVLIAVTGEEEYFLRIEERSLVGDLPNDKSITIRTDSVILVEFELIDNLVASSEYFNNADVTENKGHTVPDDYLLFCTVKSINKQNEKEFSYTFCVNPRFGDSIKSSLITK